MIMIGDFNIDINSKKGDQLENVFWSHGMRFCLEKGTHSTDYGTQIDLAFTGIEIKDAFYYESLISDHKPIFLDFEASSINRGMVGNK